MIILPLSVIDNLAPNGTALLATGSRAALFGGEVQIAGSLKTEGPVDMLALSGTPFLEIREISGTTGTGEFATTYAEGLPLGWVGDKTRLVSLEINSGTRWYSLGYWQIDGCGALGFDDGEATISAHFETSGRGLTIIYPRCNDKFENAPWRAIIMKMP